MVDVEGFLERFGAFGRRPSVERYLPLFAPDATLRDAGMAEPIGRDAIPEHIEGILKLVPDFRMVPERWRERDGTLFVEARNEATVGRTPARWHSIYCVDLEGDRVIRGRRYYDRRPLYALLDPALPALPEYVPQTQDAPPLADPLSGPEALLGELASAFEDAAPETFVRLFREDGTWTSPDLPRPLSRSEVGAYLRALGALLASPRMERVAFAGDAELAFVEWHIHARLGGSEPVLLRVADRFDLAGGRVLAGRAYFDTLELAARLAGPA